MQSTLPSSIQSLFWSDPHSPHSIEKNAPEIVHKVLALGSLEDIIWLKKAYPPTTLQHIFTDTPLPLYTPSAFHFASHIVLHLGDKIPDPKPYVKSVY